MKSYNLKPEGLHSLDDLFPEQKYCIYALDAVFENHKNKQEFLKVSLYLSQIQKTDPIEFLPKEDREGIGLNDREKRIIGESMKQEMISKLKKKLGEL